ncbi:hypothetical protein [Okeania sp. SIO1I7]|uniref:hypothetical protein n=1 Tax=Okeania sp. SIO1I7 TaxID=2607772 RepID=UPI0013FAF2CF|nr:hypothetical protein [Okeania sp. SIO1I7]NET29888.1 hypothetical protein [Okeania sp. SIO1I7]
MLTEWYFCCCINAHPSDTEAFLSIMEVLENPESDSKLLYLAYNELERTEDRMQIYALPVVFKSLRRENLPYGLKSRIEHYLGHLINNVPEKVKKSVQQLIKLPLSNQTDNFTNIIKVVSTFVKESQDLQERRLTPTPYLELKDFLPETLVLAIIADRLENNKKLVDEFIAEINDQDETSSNISMINAFLEAALDYKFGRLAFRLAASISSLILTTDTEELRILIAQKASLAAHTEPDLLHTYALILFRDTSKQNIISDQCQRIIEESWTLFKLRALIQEIPVNNSALDALFRRIGIPRTLNKTKGLPVFYWQILLWELAAQIDALTTADELGKFWHLQTSWPSVIDVNCSAADIPAKEVEVQFNSVIGLLLGLPRKIRLKVAKGKKFSIKKSKHENKYKCLFLSPWIPRTESPTKLYPRADEPTLLLRIMGSVFVAIRLLQKLAQDQNNWERVEFAARFLAHASDIITTIERRNNKKKQGETSLLSDALTGLFQFARGQIRLVGKGQLPSINPQIFVNIWEKERSSQEEQSQNPEEESLFLDLVLPEMLISWILDAYPSAVSPQLSGRWLSLIINVYNYHTAYNNISEKRHKFPERQKAALVVRFLFPKYSRTPDESLNWQNERDTNKTWEVYPRKLLLTKQRLDPNEWIELKKDLEKVKSGNERNPKMRVSNLLVCTLELLDALANLSNFKITEEDLKEYFDDLKSYLNNVEKSQDIDRFTRLRLVEFLDSSILEDRPEEQILIASILLEYGSIYDLKKMLEKVYGKEADGRTFKEIIEAARQQLQEALLPIIYKRLEKEAELLQEIHNESEDLSQSRKAQSPRQTSISLQNAEYLQEWVRKLLYLSSIQENEDFSGIGWNLANLRRRSWERQVTRGIRAKTLNVELRKLQKRLVFSEKPTDWVIKAINYNPNQFTAKVFYEEFETEEIENLFKKNPDEVSNLNHEGNVLLNVQALVVDVEQKPEDSYPWKYTFDCGFEFLLTHPSNQDLSFQSGDFVKLPIRQFKEGKKLKWEVSQQDSIERLTHKILPGDIYKISVVENWQEVLQPPRSLQLKFNGQTKAIPDKNVDISIWDADISRRFCQPSDSLKPYDVFAQLNKRQQWVPVDLDFTDLLSKLYDPQQHSNIAVLTLIGEATGKFGEKAWHFSYRPGENYLIEQHHFLGDDSEILAEEIRSLKNRRDGAVGFLITVKPDFEAKEVGLKLVTEPINPNELEIFYDNLDVPFDDRNIKWRELFYRSDEPLRAEQDDNGNWFCYLDEKNKIPGYPNRVKVQWDRVPNQRTADLIVSKWQESQWRSASVKGEVPPYYEITSDDWVAFLDRWLKRQYIEPGYRVTLKGVGPEDKYSLGSIDREKDGFVRCLTSENMLVWVQVESLTMLPKKDQERVLIGKKREAEIFWIDWQRIPIHAQTNAFPPAEVSQNQPCLGIIARVPKPDTKGTQCQVIWQVSPGKIKEQELQIENLSKIRLTQGYKIVGYKNNKGEWQFHIEKPNIRARALWSRKELKGNNLDELYYLGTWLLEGDNFAIAEQKSHPGELVYWPAQPEEISHLAVGKQDKSKVLRFKEKSLWEDYPTNNTASSRDTETYSPYRRAILEFNKQLLIGDYRNTIDNEQVAVEKIELEITPRSGEKFVLQRRFYLHPIPDIKRKQHKTSSNSSNIEVWTERLMKYLLEPYPLSATLEENGEFFLSQSQNIKVPTDSSRKNWTLWVPLAPEHGKFVMAGNYSNQAQIYLFFLEDGGVYASCRKVPPITLEEFRANYCEAPKLNTHVLLKNKNIHLYYVGPETVDKSTGRNYQETHHRFEMGYGETLLIPESKLEFNGGSFSQAQFSLFHGDLIKVISFKEAQDENSANNQQEQYILNIRSIDIQWSEARQLYEQRKTHKIVHLLHLKPQNNKLEINYIDGFNKNTTTAQHRKFDPKKFKASLSDQSQVRLSGRGQRWLDDGESDPVIFGRLDEERFRRSGGREIYFDHVRLSFQEFSKGSCLIDGEMVFLRGDRIIKLGNNDMALKLKPPKGLDPEDVGKDGKELLLLRRSFSVRENLLTQVYQEKGNMEFSDDRLLLELTSKDGQIMTSGDRTPARKAPALRGAISNHGRAGLLAVIFSAKDGDMVQIEYKPGIFIRLKADQIQSRPQNLPRGTLIRITNAPNGKFNITRAAFGNAQYVSETIRPAVMLPKNDILDYFKPEEGKHEGRFVIGGLPDIVARFGNYTDNQWQSKNTLELETIIKLMATQHPKIVCLGKDAGGNYRIAPPADDFPCGRLAKIENSFKVQYAPLHSQPTEANNPISWHLLSFGDESVEQIVERANSQLWRYHDDETFTWNTDTQEFEREKLKNRHHVWRGPIFFQLLNGEMRLRYTKSEFRRFGFPVEELIYALKDKRRSHLYPIAGVSTLNPSSQDREYSLWIELAPGRLVELPTQLIIWRYDANHQERSLTNLMHWQGFAPGDLVELEIVSTDLLTIDRIALKKWIPGVRNALGSTNRCFLPVETVDKNQGEITLGRGEFQLRLPFADENNHNLQMVILTPEDNHIQRILRQSSQENPKPNDVVFLELDSQNQLAVVGFQTIKSLPDKEEDGDMVKNLIRAAGGALPVTVKELDYTENQHLLLFSMAHQESAARIPLGRISLASFVGILPDGRTAILRCGGGLILLPMKHIVSGLAPSLYNDAVKELKKAKAKVSLWLRQEKNGIKVGFRDDPKNQDLLVESLDILLEKDEEVGLICQSIETQTLHWLPKNEAAWTELSVKEFQDVFKSKGIKVRHKLITRDNQFCKNYETYIISVLAVPDVYAEAKKLTVGQELSVEVVSNDHKKQRCLVKSLQTQVILDCEIYDNNPRLQEGETVRVEVSLHIQGSPELITVVPVGKKRKSLDLPTWMTKKLPLPGEQRLLIRDYRRWRQSDQIISRDNDDQLLCYWFNDAFGIYGKEPKDSDRERQLETAKNWEQKNRYQEIYAAFAIIAILLLNKHKKTKFEAYKLTQKLGQRALRSLHIEVIYQRWLSSPNRELTSGLWQRLRAIEVQKHLEVPLKENSPDAIRQFCNAVEMRSKSALLPIANSLSAALGELSNPLEIQEDTVITKELIALYHTLHPLSKIKELQNYHINKLQEILKRIDQGEHDIMLLEPLNYETDNYSEDSGGIDLLAELFPPDQGEIDWKNWILEEIGQLDDLTEKYTLLEGKINKLKAGFQRINIIKIMEE